jgi:hypothetical protein
MPIFLEKSRKSRASQFSALGASPSHFSRFFQFLCKNTQESVKNSNFFFIFHVYISEMAKMRERRVKTKCKSLLFTPPFFEGFKIDPLII